jgi:hypothetical protein
MTIDPAATAPRRRTWKTWMAIGLAAVGLAGGIAGSWVYNNGYRSRAADDSAIIVSGADLPTFAGHGSDRSEITMPVTNDSPDTVKIFQVQFVNAPTLTWQGPDTVIPAGKTAYLTVRASADCPVTVAPGPIPTTLARALLHVQTTSGKPHGINLYYSGVLAYAAWECGLPPSPSRTP